MSEEKVVAEIRESFGKGYARRLRAAGRIPAVIYGHGTDPQHVSLPGHQVSLLLRRANALLDLDIAGKAELALVKDVQRDPVRQIIEHIDLLVVKRGEKITVDVPVHVEGESFSGTIVNHSATTISIEAEATHIPEHITVNVDGLEDGTQILAKDVELPKGTTLLSDPEMLVVGITTPSSGGSASVDAAEDAPAGEGETAAEAAGDDAESSEESAE
jgi:large subunit ribosomal protein L25